MRPTCAHCNRLGLNRCAHYAPTTMRSLRIYIFWILPDGPQLRPLCAHYVPTMRPLSMCLNRLGVSSDGPLPHAFICVRRENVRCSVAILAQAGLSFCLPSISFCLTAMADSWWSSPGWWQERSSSDRWQERGSSSDRWHDPRWSVGPWDWDDGWSDQTISSDEWQDGPARDYWPDRLDEMYEATGVWVSVMHGKRNPGHTLPTLEGLEPVTTGGSWLLQMRPVQGAQPMKRKGHYGMKVPTRTGTVLKPIGTAGTTVPWLLQLRYANSNARSPTFPLGKLSAGSS